MGVIHAFDGARKDVKCGGVLVWRYWSWFQLGAPGIRKSERTVRRGGGVCDMFTERGEGKIESRCDWLEEFGIDIDYLRDRAKTSGLMTVGGNEW